MHKKSLTFFPVIHPLCSDPQKCQKFSSSTYTQQEIGETQSPESPGWFWKCFFLLTNSYFMWSEITISTSPIISFQELSL